MSAKTLLAKIGIVAATGCGAIYCISQLPREAAPIKLGLGLAGAVATSYAAYKFTREQREDERNYRNRD